MHGSKYHSNSYMFQQAWHFTSKYLFTLSRFLRKRSDNLGNNGFQRVIEELRTSIREAKLHEREIFYTYLARCNVFYGSYIAGTYSMVLICIYAPIIFPLSSIIHAEYPFDVNRTLVSVIVRAHQSIACCQCCAHVCLSVFGALLIWFTAARFECLAVEMQRSTDIGTMSICIGKQLRLKR